MAFRVPARSGASRYAGGRTGELASSSAFIHPSFRALPPPVIIIGMNRSGTSLAAAMLSTLGVYMGPDLSIPVGNDAASMSRAQAGYCEARAFYSLNEQVLYQAGAAWHKLEPLFERRNNPLFRAGSIAMLRLATFGSLRSGFLRSFSRGAWGWKDPRNSLTLSYWLELFPQARVLHVRREPKGVVESLYRRAQKWAAPAENGEPASQPGTPREWMLGRALLNPGSALLAVARKLRREPAPGPADPCLDRDYCELLRQQYVEECLRYQNLGNRYMEVWYEDAQRCPERVACELAQFADVDVTPRRLAEAAALVRRPGSAA